MEIVIVMALGFLMLGVVGIMFSSYVKNYKNTLLQNSGFNYLNTAIVMIDSHVNQFASEVKTEENVINMKGFVEENVKHKNGLIEEHVKYIKCVNGKLSVFTKTDDGFEPNTIMNDVKDFVAIKYRRILYIKIIWKNGQSIERCLAIENAN